MTWRAKTVAVAVALALGLAGAWPLAGEHGHAHAHAVAAQAPHAAGPEHADGDGPAARGAEEPGPEAPPEHGRRHAGGACHGPVCWSLFASPAVPALASRLPDARVTGRPGPMPRGPDLQGDPPVPKHA